MQGELTISGGSLSAISKWTSANANLISEARILLEQGEEAVIFEDNIGNIEADELILDAHTADVTEDIGVDTESNGRVRSMTLEEFAGKIPEGSVKQVHESSTKFEVHVSLLEAVGLPKAPLLGSAEYIGALTWLKSNILAENNKLIVSEVTIPGVKGNAEVAWEHPASYIFEAEYNDNLVSSSLAVIENDEEDDNEDQILNIDPEALELQQLISQLTGYELIIELKSKSYFSGAVASLGKCCITAASLAKLCQSAAPQWFTLESSSSRKICIVGRLMVSNSKSNSNISGSEIQGQLSLATQSKSIISVNYASAKKSGKWFSILHRANVVPHRTLTLCVVSVTGLPAGRSSLRSKLPSICVTITYNGVRIGKTPIADKGLDCRWDEMSSSCFYSINVPIIEPLVQQTKTQNVPIEHLHHRKGVFAPLVPLANRSDVSKTLLHGVLQSDLLQCQIWDASKATKLLSHNSISQNAGFTDGLLIAEVNIRGQQLAELITLQRGQGKRKTFSVFEASRNHHAPVVKVGKTEECEGESDKSIGKLELAIMDNSDCIQSAASANSSAYASSQKLSGRYDNRSGLNMVVLDQRPLNRETDLVLTVTGLRNIRHSVFVSNPNNKKGAGCLMFFVVWFGERLIGRSSIVANRSSIVSWDKDHFVIPLNTSLVTTDTYLQVPEEKLIVEVYLKKLNCMSEFVGCVSIPTSEFTNFTQSEVKQPDSLVPIIDQESAQLEWISLRPSEQFPSHLQSAVGGEIRISLQPPKDDLTGQFVANIDSEDIPTGIPLAFEITVCNAENLGRADTFGLSDPFCIIKFNSLEIGRTSVVRKSVNPVWSGERFVVMITVPESKASSISLPPDCALQVCILFCQSQITNI